MKAEFFRISFMIHKTHISKKIMKEFYGLESRLVASVHLTLSKTADFNQFLSENPHFEFGSGGIRKDSQRELKSKLIDFMASIDSSSSTTYSRDDVVDLRYHVNKFLKAAEAFEQKLRSVSLDKSISGEATEDSEQSVSPKHLAHTWLLYYLHLTDRDYTPKIARLILEVYSDKSVRLTNLNEAQSENYGGVCRKLKSSEVWHFSLRDKQEPNNRRELDFKVEYPNKDYHILFGAYTTLQQKRIYAGSLVLERLTPKVERRIGVVEPLKISYKDTLDESTFNSQVPRSIQEFLSIKRKNYYKVPEPFWGIQQLEKYVHNYKFDKEREGRFFDPKKPKLFLAYPQTAIQDIDLNTLNGLSLKVESAIDILERELPQIKISHVTKTNDSKEDEDSFKNLQELMTTRYFVLILGDINKATFAMVQLGWALSYSKHIMVFYKHGNISSRVGALEELNVNLVPYNNLSDDLNEIIIPKILKFVRKN